MVAWACTIIAAFFALLSAFWQHLAAGATVSMMDAFAYGTASARVGAGAMALGWLGAGLTGFAAMGLLLYIVVLSLLVQFANGDESSSEEGSGPVHARPQSPWFPPQYPQHMPEMTGMPWAPGAARGPSGYYGPRPQRGPWAKGAMPEPWTASAGRMPPTPPSPPPSQWPRTQNDTKISRKTV